mgnify:CR=1 FL=1
MPEKKNDIYLYIAEPTSENSDVMLKEMVFNEQFGKMLIEYEIIENAFYGGKLIKIPKKFSDSTPFDPDNFIEIIFSDAEMLIIITLL